MPHITNNQQHYEDDLTDKLPRKVITGWLRPMCVECQVQMDVIHSGVPVILIDRIDPQHPRVMHYADEYECPYCHKKMIAGYSAPHYNQNEIDYELSGGKYIRIFEDVELANQELGRVHKDKTNHRA